MTKPNIENLRTIYIANVAQNHARLAAAGHLPNWTDADREAAERDFASAVNDRVIEEILSLANFAEVEDLSGPQVSEWLRKVAQQRGTWFE